MPDESLVELTVEHEGTTYKLVNGDLYRVASPDRLVFVEKNLRQGILGKELRPKTDRSSGWTDTGKEYPTRRYFEEGFENAD